MNTPEYLILLAQNSWLFALSVAITFLLYYLLFKRYYLSIFDPLLLSLLFSATGFSTVLFLILCNQIPLIHSINYFITQAAFTGGFLLFSPLKVKTFSSNIKNHQLLEFDFFYFKFTYIVIFFILVTSTLIDYRLNGIPITRFSRLDMDVNTNEARFFKRLSDTMLPLSIFFSIYFLQKAKMSGFRVFNYLFLCTVVSIIILNGGKSQVLLLFSALFFYSIYAVRWGEFAAKEILEKYTVKLMLLVLTLVFVVVFFSTDKKGDTLFIILYRLAIGGDTYYMAYPNNVINEINTYPWYISLFASPLKMLHVISDSQMPKSIGATLMEYHILAKDITFGPNPRHNIFGIVSFGYFGYFYSFIIGFLFSYVRNKLYDKLPKNILGCIFLFLLYNAMSKIETDYYLSLADIINIVMFIFPILIISFFCVKIYYVSSKKSIDHNPVL